MDIIGFDSGSMLTRQWAIIKNNADSSCLNQLVSLELYTEDPAPDI